MNKTLKVILVILLMLVALFILTGCGNKLVATKTSEEEGLDGEKMKIEEKIEVSFKGNKVNTVKKTYTFEKEEDVESMKAMYELMKAFGGEDLKIDVEQTGKKLVIDLDSKAYAEIVANSNEAEMTKKEIKRSLEEDGYKVK